MIAAGVDVGSTATKAVLMDDNRRIVGRSVIKTGAHVVKAAERVFAEAVRAAGIEEHDVAQVVGTGYGRYKVSFGHAQVTEISCHARGAAFLFPGTRVILDIGGQDTKAIRIAPGGEVEDFCMNDKCAAGTGRFLEAASATMAIPLDAIGPLSLQYRQVLKVTNVCTVFVESEILAHLSRGRAPADILRGVHLAIAGRSVALLRRVGLDPEITFTGGVSRNVGIVQALEEKLQLTLNVSEDSQFMGAIGAALFALERGHALPAAGPSPEHPAVAGHPTPAGATHVARAGASITGGADVGMDRGN
jgi:(R)-2-hydroxyacyl-CoA dehydratese activating ATPase